MKGLPVYLSLILITLLVKSQTIIPGGEVSGTWHAGQSPFHVQGNIVINYDSTLIIEPGVEVYFDDSYKLTVHGRLEASGTETDSILFTATNTTTGWQGVEFYQINEDLGVSRLQYGILTYGRKNSGSGGAIYVYQSDNVLIDHCRIEHNYALQGGGIFIDDGWIDINNCMIRYNSAKYYAGGITCLSSEPYFYNIMISDNTSAEAGGMFFAYNPSNSYPQLENLTVTSNIGGQVGGIWFQEASTLVLNNCKICYNRGNYCGGIVFVFSGLAYWGPGINSQVYMNRGNLVHDLFYAGEDNTIMYLDTFTVINPDSYHAFPLDKFNFHNGIQHGIIEQVDADLYISDSGSDLNDGLTLESPLRSFDYALRKIKSNAEDNNTLWVMPGHYSLGESDSALPVIIKDNVKIKATVAGEAILDGDSNSRVIYGNTRNNFTLSGLTITNGFIDYLDGAVYVEQVSGAGIYLNSSTGKIDSCTFISNSTTNWGGGAFFGGTYDLHLKNCDFVQNSADKGGGGLYAQNDLGNTDATLTLDFCQFLKNSGGALGGGIVCQSNDIWINGCGFIENTCTGNGAGGYFMNDMPDLVNCIFADNVAGENGGGCYIVGGTSANMINCTFADNQALSGSAVYQVYLAKLYSINTIFWNHSFHHDGLIHVMAANSEDYIRFYTNYSDIQGGENSIVLEGYYAKRYWQEGNFSLDPAYIDHENGDYSLNWNSPCIEAGKPDTTGLNLPETDLNGNPRIVNERVDMGAYEYQFPVDIGRSIHHDPETEIIVNKSNSLLTVAVPDYLKNSSLMIRIVAVDGKTIHSSVKSRGEAITTIALPDIPPGVYLVTVTDNNYLLVTKKILIN